MTIKVRLKVNDYVLIGEEYERITVVKKFAVSTYDDLQNLLLTLIEASTDTVTFEISKEDE